jgi:hypothetical protein
MTELLGYAASIFVALSLVMVSLVKLRIINLIGCIFFVIYGSLIQAWPIVATNGFIVCVNIFYLVRMFRRDTSNFSYSLLKAEETDLVVRFLQEKYTDCQRFYPLFATKMISYAFSGNGLIYGAFRRNRLNGISVLLRLDNLLEFAPRFWDDSNASDSHKFVEHSGSISSGGTEPEPFIAGAENTSPADSQNSKSPRETPRKHSEGHGASGPPEASMNSLFLKVIRLVGERKPPESTVLMPADYLVPKYRDLGVVGKFHQRLLADLPQGIDHVVCPVNRSDLGTRRYFQRNGYEKLLSHDELTIFELDLKHLRRHIEPQG